MICSDLGWATRWNDRRMIKQTFDMYAKRPWKDESNKFYHYDCYDRVGSVSKECIKWDATFDRFFTSSLKAPMVGDDSHFWLTLDHIDILTYYCHAMLWASQFISRNFIINYNTVNQHEVLTYLIGIFIT